MSGRRLTAALVGFVVGVAVFVVFASAGLLLDQRLAGDSLPIFVGVLLFFGCAGGYAGWLVGLIVFSAVRGPDDEAAPNRR